MASCDCDNLAPWPSEPRHPVASSAPLDCSLSKHVEDCIFDVGKGPVYATELGMFSTLPYWREKNRSERDGVFTIMLRFLLAPQISLGVSSYLLEGPTRIFRK